ncbi:MAG: PASTA domain-containing protein [Treponema sp.]|nr:PASTA domain-containing protein [Treponema sp.]
MAGLHERRQEFYGYKAGVRNYMRIFNFDLSSIEDYVSNHLKVFILSVAGLLVIVGIIAISIFFIAVRGAEQCMVPDVTGRELTEALLELQVKELYPRLQLRYSQSAHDRGLIIEQEPRAGTIVKAGRRVRLVVSQGVMISRVENYVGRNIDEVRMDLQTLYSASGGLPLLSLKEPLMFDFSAETPGTILAQKPEPGADISGPLALEFVVSRGLENTVIIVPQLTGLELSRALELIGSMGINFEFSLREIRGSETGETIVYQNPPANTSMPIDNVVRLIVNVPDDLAGGEVFNLFRYSVPKNPYPLAMRLEALLPAGDRIRLINVEYPGGDFSVPYRLPLGSTLVLSMLNREIYRETVNAQQYLEEYF